MGESISRRGFFGHAAGAYVLASGVTVGAVVAADPIITAIRRYEAARDAAYALPADFQSGPAFDEAYEANVLPLFWQIGDVQPTTVAGAIAALRFVMDENEGGISSLSRPLMERAVRFLESEAA